MKKITVFLVFAFFLIVTARAFAGTSVGFSWDYPDPTPSDLAGFILQQKDGIGWIDVLPNIDKDARECTLIDVADGIYIWRLLAIDFGDQRSGPSNEITETIDGPPPKPESFRIIAEISFKIRNGEIIMSKCETYVEPFN
jgi:hypothetical protein